MAAPARQVHAAIAAGLANPGFLDQLCRYPEFSRAVGIEPGTLDLTRLRKLSGLGTKVRHPDLRDALPVTMRCLECAGIEIDVFAQFTEAATALKRSGRSALAERIEAFGETLDAFLEPDAVTRPTIESIVRHEAFVARLLMLAAAGAPTCRPPMTIATDAVPAIVGALFLQAFARDPRTIVEMMPPGCKELAPAPPAAVRLAYWWDGETRAVRIFELDELAFRLLGLVDGRASIARIAQRLSASVGEVPAPALFAPLAQLADLGLLTAASGPDG